METMQIENKETITFAMVEYSDWNCRLFAGGEGGISFRPPKGQEPCWFWRKMQWLCFGNEWTKDEVG